MYAFSLITKEANRMKEKKKTKVLYRDCAYFQDHSVSAVLARNLNIKNW